MKNFNKIVAVGAVLATIALQSGVAFAATSATVQSDTLSRAKVGEVATHDIKLTLGAPATSFTITLPADFGGWTGSANDFGGSATTSGEVATVTGSFSAGSLEITGLSATNPSSAGSYYVALGGTDVSGGYALAIVTDDQVGVTASVNPSITFNVGAQAMGTNCDADFVGNGGTVALGTLALGTITSSDVNSVAHICTRVSTNATLGAIVTVKSATNDGLKSISVPNDNIPSATAAMDGNTANYGLCADATQHGADGINSVAKPTATNPASLNPTAVDPFIASCAHNTNTGSVGALTTTAQKVWGVDGPTADSFQNLVIKAAISGTTKAHSDYADTLTFVATGTF
jgi:hypothetical protein